jgi:hypothetical protein
MEKSGALTSMMWDDEGVCVFRFVYRNMLCCFGWTSTEKVKEQYG